MEESLWGKFKKGDKEAFASLYCMHIDHLFSYGIKICSNANVVKDSIQDLFIELFEHRNQLSEPNEIRYYLFKVLKRTIFKKIKSDSKTVSLSLMNTSQFCLERNFESKLIDSEFDNRRKELLYSAVRNLSSKQKEILYLRFTMGFSYLEISKIIQIDQASVRKQVYRAIKKLRESTIIKNHASVVLLFTL